MSRSACRWTRWLPTAILGALLAGGSMTSPLAAQTARRPHGRATPKKPVAPFLVDSSYDRFEDAYSVRLVSGPIMTSIPGLRFVFVAPCEANGPCSFEALNLALVAPHATRQQRVVYDELKDGIACTALIFHGADGGTARNDGCFQTQGAALEKGFALARAVDMTASLLDSAFRNAAWLEGRFGVTGMDAGPTFRVGSDTLAKVRPFFAEVDRRRASR